MAQCPSGYWGTGNSYGTPYCDSNKCSLFSSQRTYQRHVYLRCQNSSGKIQDVYSHTEKLRCC